REQSLSIAREPDRAALLRETGRQTSPRLAAIDARIHSQRHASVQHPTHGEGIYRATLYSSSSGIRKFLSRRLRRCDPPKSVENTDAKGLAASADLRRPSNEQRWAKHFRRRIIADQSAGASGRSRSTTGARRSLSWRSGQWRAQESYCHCAKSKQPARWQRQLHLPRYRSRDRKRHLRLQRARRTHAPVHHASARTAPNHLVVEPTASHFGENVQMLR